MCEDEDCMVDEGDEDHERCPFCNRINNPGAMDACHHFQAMLWEGEIIWSDDYEAFETAFNGFGELQERFLEEFNEDIRPILKTIAKEAGVPNNFVVVGGYDAYSAVDALQELADFVVGKSVETDGMLSGNGCTLYHENPKVILEAAEGYKLLSLLLRDIILGSPGLKETH
ncbi:MAG: hypothetical protein EOM37_14400 [Proteobacteria bacterium]|nr:hypothetical protein [Pseudomonadota bacterium]